ncbi:aldolase [Palaeococcus ferrophilus]|uniref:aldolase n=1 Tax=Palaeococcus ferrophilus TaxID=83868 RepID=UPI00064E69B4|nr:aldolase [Palaeococcus ferrophilus]
MNSPVFQLVKYSRLAHERGLTAAFGGNLSVLFNGKIFVKATGAVMDDMSGAQVAVMTLDGKQVGGVRPSSEWRLHLAIYRAREDVRAIAHLHPSYSIAVSNIGERLPIITPEAELYLRRIPVVPFRPAGSEELAEEIAKVMEEYDAAIMENHGIVTVGRTLREAFYKAELVEESAKLWYLREKH